MTADRFTVDSDGKYWDRLSRKYVTIDHLFYLVEKLEKENKELKERLAEREKMLDVRDKIIGDVSKALNGDLK